MEHLLILGDCLEAMEKMDDCSVHCCVTSPPYWGLRDYGADGQLGLEQSPQEYVDKLVSVFVEVRRILRDDGTLWLNLGDSYVGAGRTNSSGGPSAKQMSNAGSWFEPRRLDAGLRPKNLVGMPWRVAFALQASGWYLRSDIIWHKPNPMPESVKDRPTKAHEYLFLLSKSPKYYYDAEAIAEPALHAGEDVHNRGGKNAQMGKYGATRSGFIGTVRVGATRNRRTVWTVPTQPFPGAHFAVMPEKLVEPCVLAGCPEEGTVLDPFAGSGTVGVVAARYRRGFVGIELNRDYVDIARGRIAQTQALML